MIENPTLGIGFRFRTIVRIATRISGRTSFRTEISSRWCRGYSTFSNRSCHMVQVLIPVEICLKTMAI